MSYPPLLIERRAQQAFSVTTTKAHDGRLGPDLESLLNEAGLRYSAEHRAYMVGPDADWSSLVSYVVTILGAAGGLGGIAALLKAFFGRHKGNSVKFGEDGQVLQADGLSVDDIVRLLDECGPRMPPDYVVRDARGTDDTADQIYPGEEYRLAMGEARQRSRDGSPQEVVVYRDGEPRVVRRYEDGHEIPRPPGCPPWCDEGHDDPHGPPVRHSGTIGTFTQPDGAEVFVDISRDPDGQSEVTVGGWAPPSGFDGRRLPDDFRGLFIIPADDAVQLAGLVDLLGHADLAEQLRNAATTVTADPPAAGEAGP